MFRLLHVIIIKFEIHDKIDYIYIYSNNGVKMFWEFNTLTPFFNPLNICTPLFLYDNDDMESLKLHLLFINC